jgi:thioredoxin
MAKDITTDFFSKNIYDFKNVDDSGELKFLGKNPVVVDFHAPWCGPCRVLGPIVDELDEEYNNVDFYKVNTEDEMELAAAFGVMSLPTLLFIPKKGKPMMSPGAPSKDMIKELVDEKLLGKEPTKSDKDKKLDEAVSTFNKLMTKIKEVIDK